MVTSKLVSCYLKQSCKLQGIFSTMNTTQYFPHPSGDAISKYILSYLPFVVLLWLLIQTLGICEAFNCTASAQKHCDTCPAGTCSNKSIPECLCCQTGGQCIFNMTLTNTGENSSYCALCSPGFFQHKPEQTECLPCEPGFYASISGSLECIPCPAGQFVNVSAATYCFLCPRGTYQAEPGENTCSDCQAGTESRSEGSIKCQLCPVGFYKNQPSPEICDPCLPGSFAALPGQSVCELCSPGFYQNQPAAPSCTSCDIGTYCNTTGCKFCENCPAGEEATNLSTINCTLCEKGTYKPYAAANLCRSCAAGYVALEEGLHSCIECSAGFYCPCPTCSPRPCPAHAVCPAGSYTPKPCEPPWSISGEGQHCYYSVQFITVVSGVLAGVLVMTVIGWLCYKYEHSRIPPLRSTSHQHNGLVESEPLLGKENDGRHQGPVYTGL